MTPKFAVVADDLTGACDAASILAEYGENPVLKIDAGGFGQGGGCSVVNTQSRTLDRIKAYRIVRSVAERLPRGSIAVKKIDTAFRGNVGAEIEAMLNGLGLEKALVVNAIPELGRTTKNGVQYMGGVPIDRTGFAGDPCNPVAHARIADILAQTTDLPAERMKVLDAETREDIDRIVREYQDGVAEVLWVGSLGILRGLASVHCTAVRRDFIRGLSNGRLLGMTCSLHEATALQLKTAEESGDCTVIRIRLEPCGDYLIASEDIERRMADAYRQVRTVFLAAELSGGDKGYGQLITKTMAGFFRKAVRGFQPEGLILIGGETSHAAMKMLGVTELKRFEPFETGIVKAYAADGDIRDLPVVLKGGSVGDGKALMRIFKSI